MITQKSYGRMQEYWSVSNDRMSTNLSTARSSEYIYYYIFGPFLHGQGIEICFHSLLITVYALLERVFLLLSQENSFVDVFCSQS